MASAITKHLLLSLPDASIMYAPTIELAGWILRSRPINLIISSEILPDGGSHKLHSVIKKLKNPPDVLMVGNSVRSSVQQLRRVGYRMVSRRTLRSSPQEPTTLEPQSPSTPEVKTQVHAKVSTLSADLRNDFNNPLQEIVTMAFVARQSPEQQELASDALQAIEKAAKQLAGTVDGLEDRIKAAVAS